jgi:SAM-dependent methyltransferase
VESVDPWKYFDITHRDHVLCNPTSIAKTDELIGLLDLPQNPRILEIACGKGEFLVRTVERYGGPAGHGVSGVAIDLSPFCVRDVRDRLSRRAPAASIEVLEMDGADYHPAPAFDLAVCMGASWTFGGHGATLRALRAAVRRGGQVLVGEPYFMRPPDPAYLAAAGIRPDEFATHAANVQAGVDAALEPLLALASNGDDWDRYETLQWRASNRWAAEHPDDPDAAAVLERVERDRRTYLEWGRDTLGWALYLFRGAVAGD